MWCAGPPCSEQCSACAALCRSPGHPKPPAPQAFFTIVPLFLFFRERERERKRKREERSVLGERSGVRSSGVKLRKKRNTRHKRNIVDFVIVSLSKRNTSGTSGRITSNLVAALDHRLRR